MQECLGAILFEVIEHHRHIPLRIRRVIEGTDLQLHGHPHRLPQHIKIIVRVGGGQCQEDAATPSAHELQDAGAILNTAVGNEHHAGRRLCDMIISHGHVDLPHHRGMHKELQTWHKGKEAQKDDGDDHVGTQHIQAVRRVAIGLIAALGNKPCDYPDDVGGTAEHDQGELIEDEAFPAGQTWKSPLLTPSHTWIAESLEEDVVAHAEIQELQPESIPNAVKHAQDEGIGGRGCDRGALGHTAPRRRRHKARLNAACVKWTDGDLADAFLVARALPIRHGAGEDHEWAIRVLQKLVPCNVFAFFEVRQPQAASVEVVRGEVDGVEENHQEEGED
mmetsp:Transcript_58508/g.169763  ORF Transcript_58508/g.169763 Transcript_58508/m.169763 type:complete len:334 (-) Transcript_58508:137-1138(-)